MLVAAISDGTWAFLGVCVTQIVLLATLLFRQGKARESIEQINTAVNHQGKDAQGKDRPTLIHRMIEVEEAVKVAHSHRAWERESFIKLAHHVGCILPPYPHHDREDEFTEA